MPKITRAKISKAKISKAKISKAKISKAKISNRSDRTCDSPSSSGPFPIAKTQCADSKDADSQKASLNQQPARDGGGAQSSARCRPPSDPVPGLPSIPTPQSFPLTVRSVIHRVQSPHESNSRDKREGRTEHRRGRFSHTINPYRGCAFACRYCYARYTHEWIGLNGEEDFDSKIGIKENFATTLARDLRRLRHRRERVVSIAIGTATDPYQPFEHQYGLTRASLRVFAESTGWDLSITTKSVLILRDLDLLKEVARNNSLVIHMTITTPRRDLARSLEPGAPSPKARLEAVRVLVDHGIRVVPFVCPIIPGINDRTEDLEELFGELSKLGVDQVICEAVFLRSPTREVFLQYLDGQFPELAAAYRRRFRETAYLSPVEVERLRGRIDRLRTRHRLRGKQHLSSTGGRFRSEARGVPQEPPPRRLPWREAPRSLRGAADQLTFSFERSL